METQFFKSTVNITPQGAKNDTNAPYSFLEWKQRTPNLPESQLFSFYNIYVRQWFENKKETIVSHTFALRQKYLFLLDQLDLVFTEQEKIDWYNKINLANEQELLIAIPYFARKLKNIALYYMKLRKKLQRAKIDYSTVGTKTAIEQQVYRYFLELFSPDGEPDLVFENQPNFSDLQQTLRISVQELYDDHVYLDRDPRVNVSSYYNVLDQATASFFATKGITLSSSDWIFTSFDIETLSGIETFVSTITANIFEQTSTEALGTFVQTFLGENKNITETILVSTESRSYDLAITPGTNVFYYPYGIAPAVLTSEETFIPVALSSLNIEGATAGLTIEEADTITVRSGSTTNRAWLYREDYIPSNETVKVTFEKGKNAPFIFPYPGFGLSATDVQWTGASLEETPEYRFLSKSIKSAVDSEYWSLNATDKDCDPINVNSTTLAANGATPHRVAALADTILTYNRSEANDAVSTNTDTQAAWLFKHEVTALPITNGSNVLFWPYERLATNEDFPVKFRGLDFDSVCDPVPIESLEIPFAVAGDSIDNADRIYRLEKYTDKLENAVQCAWLSGAVSESQSYKYIQQKGFSGLFNSGEVTRFVWTGPQTKIEDVFKSINHNSDCPYFFKKLGLNQVGECLCKQVYYSPFGHSGATFTANAMFADCVIEDTENTLADFDFGSWRDKDGDYIENVFSSQFAWYKTKTSLGFGDGRWVVGNNPSSSVFYLLPGKAYFYRRVSGRIYDVEFPPYVVYYPFKQDNTVWVDSKFDGTDWISTGQKSNFSIYPGDILCYERRDVTDFYLMSSVPVENVSENKTESIWATYDTVAIDSGAPTTLLAWPTGIPDLNSSDGQIPSTKFYELTSGWIWTITGPDGVSKKYKTPILSFTPTTEGVYSVSVSAYSNTGFIKFPQGSGTFIPAITAISKYKQEPYPIQSAFPNAGFLLEHSLQGWSYDRGQRRAGATGSRPFWSELYIDKNAATKFKAIPISEKKRTFIDGYIPDNSPKFSSMQLTYDRVFEFDHKGDTMFWQQPINFYNGSFRNIWCKIKTTEEPSALQSIFKTENREDYASIATTEPSDIVLSNISNGGPVRVEYHALNDFTWSITTTVNKTSVNRTTGVYLESPNPVSNLSNRFYPTIATVPVLEDVYSQSDVGGYFLPQNLGMSVAINRGFTPSVITDKNGVTFDNTQTHVGGVGFTKVNQPTDYKWTENNTWVVEPATAGSLAGTPKKLLTRELQTFVPYQSNSTETSIGLLTNTSIFTPWGGTFGDQWRDNLNNPVTFTGLRNLSAWLETQEIKQSQMSLDGWTSDIFGNQYGLFKNTDGLSVAERKQQGGSLWVRTNEQLVLPATKALSALYGDFPQATQNQLVSGIRAIDCFYNTLMIELSSTVIFSTLDFSYDTNQIDAKSNTTYTFNLTGNKSFTGTWFFGKQKTVSVCVTTLSGNIFYPEIYNIDISTGIQTQVYPNEAEKTLLQQNLSSVSVSAVPQGVYSFNSDMNKYLVSYRGEKTNGDLFVANFIILNGYVGTLTDLEIYE